MSIWQGLLIFVGIVFAGYVSALQFIEPNSFGESVHLKAFATFSKDNRVWLSFIFTLLASAIAASAVFLKPRKLKKIFLESLIDGIFEHMLDNDPNSARVTIYKDAGRLRTYWYKLKDFVSLTRKIGPVAAWKYCWNANYIVIFKRWGNHSRNSTTYFCVNLNNPDDCQGIAGEVRQRQAQIKRELPNIDGWDLTAVGVNHPDVKRYMEEGNIKDFNLLKKINKRAPFICGNIISTNGGSRKYVLLVDSWAVKSPFTNHKLVALGRYVKHLSVALQ